MNRLSVDRLTFLGIGIRPSTYFMVLSILYADDKQEYGIAHKAVFGVN